jgi:hypothetical protein
MMRKQFFIILRRVKSSQGKQGAVASGRLPENKHVDSDFTTTDPNHFVIPRSAATRNLL